MRTIATLALCVALSANEGSAADIPGSDFNYGNWFGAAYTFDDTGRFSHCAISAEFNSGLSLMFSVNQDASVGVGVIGNLGLTEGQVFPVALFVDRRAPFYGQATALAPDFAALTIYDFAPAMNAFQRGFELRIDALGGSSFFRLDGTFRALEAARQCALRYLNYQGQPSAPTVARIDKTATFQLSTLIIAELGVKDFRYLSEAELIDLGWENVVAWEAPQSGMSGLSLIMPFDASAGSLRDTDPADTAFIAQGCDGDYATSARSVVLEDGAEARELRLLCTADSGGLEMFLSKFQAGESVIYNVLVFEEGNTTPPAERRESSEAATLRAASFASQ